MAESPTPAPPATGVPAVDAARRRLEDLDQAPLDGHVEIFDDVQRRLHDGLAELDDSSPDQSRHDSAS